MKEKWSQKDVDNFWFLVIILLVSCTVAAVVFMPVSPNPSPEERLQSCEKYGILSEKKFAKLKGEYFFYECHKRDCTILRYRAKEISDQYEEQQKLRQICLNSSVDPLKIELYFKEKEINELNNANKKLQTEKEANAKCSSKEVEKLKKLKAAFRKTSENINKRSIKLFGIPFDPFQRCLKNYNNLVETFAEIYDLEVE